MPTFGENDKKASVRAPTFAILFGFAAIGLVNALIFILSIPSVILQNNTVRSVMGFAVAGKVLTR